MKEHILNHIGNDRAITILKDCEIDCIVMSLIAIYNRLIMNRLPGGEEEANRKMWVESVSRILGLPRSPDKLSIENPSFVLCIFVLISLH
jgi:hypothetical protein